MSRKFDIYTDGKGKTVAVTYYGGRAFRGVAKCAPDDKYYEETGVALATARCKQKLFKAKRQVAVQKKAYYDSIIKYFEKLRDEAEVYANDCIENIESVEADIRRMTEG